MHSEDKNRHFLMRPGTHVTIVCPKNDPTGARPFYYRGFWHSFFFTVTNLIRYRSFRHPMDNRHGD